jgi:predicted TIM-barrel fold metal-dependent hydrolase
MRILDTHLHLIHKDKFTYPWLSDVPALDRQWTAESYFAEAEGIGIEAALHMEVDVLERQAEDETRFVLDGVHPRIIGAIAAVRPEHLDFPRHLERLAAMPGVKGVRRVLHTQPDELSQSAFFADNLRRLPEYDLTFDLCVLPTQLNIAAALAARCPETRFVLDHCGNPPIASGDLGSWREGVRAVAAHPNVAGKISGIVNHAAPGWTAETLRPVFDHMIDCFGWDRLVWGSDHPVCTITGANLTRWVEATRRLVAHGSLEDQAKVLHRNAERIYRVAPQPA